MLKLYTWMHEKESGVSTEVTTKKPFVYTEPLTTLIYIYNPLPKNVWTLFTKPPICFWWVINYFPTLLFYYIYLYDMIYYIYDYIYIVIYIYISHNYMFCKAMFTTCFFKYTSYGVHLCPYMRMHVICLSTNEPINVHDESSMRSKCTQRINTTADNIVVALPFLR